MKSAILIVISQASPLSAFVTPTDRGRVVSSASTSLFSSPSAGAFSNEDIETAFFSIDVEATGNIPRSSFADALADLGVELPESQTNELFDKYDEDKGGSIDLDEFKSLMSDPKMSGIKPDRYVRVCVLCFDDQYDILIFNKLMLLFSYFLHRITDSFSRKLKEKE